VNTGQVHVFYGSPAGLTADSAVHDDQLFDRSMPGLGSLFSNVFFGEVLAAGDFDHDGFADLVIGIPHEVAGGTFGLSGVLSTVTQNSLFGSGNSESGDNFGISLGVGDFNNDGFADLAVGVPFEDLVTTDDGEVDVVYGTAAGLGPTHVQRWNQLVLTIDSPQAGDHFGGSLSARPLNSNGLANP
jgi:hypothetical protein